MGRPQQRRGGTSANDAAATAPFHLERDEHLHARVVGRDESAVLECFDLWAETLYCAALGLTGDAGVAADLTELAFLDLRERPAAFDPARGPLVLQLVRTVLQRLIADSARS